MRPFKKIAIGLGAIAALLIIAMLVVSFAFRDRIASRLKGEVNRSLNAQVNWESAGLGLLRDFPNVTLTLAELSVVGVKPFAGDTLAAIRRARLVLDLGSVVGHLRNGDRIVVREMSFQQPTLNLRRLADGRANWNITRRQQRAAADTARGVSVTLRDLGVADGSVTLDDRQARLEASLRGLDAALSGDFARDRFVLATRTRADTVSLRFAGIPYLTRVGVELKTDIDADLPKGRFTFTNDSLQINALVLAFSGSVTLQEPDVALDLTFSAPSTLFRDILSLVPAIYAQEFRQLQTAGTMAVAGRVLGNHGPDAFPSFALRATVDKGAFRYPSLPLSAGGVSLELAIDNPGGHADNTVIDLKRFHAVVGGRPLDARLVMRTPVSDPDLDLRLIGGLDLADVGRTVKLPAANQWTGLVAADVAMRARMSDVDAGRYDRVAASGMVNVARVALRSASMPHAVTIDTAALRLTPRATELTALVAKIGSSDVRVTASFTNVLAFALRDEELRGNAILESEYFDLNEWRSKEKASKVIPVPSGVDVTVNASAKRVTYGALTLANVRGNLRLKDQRATLDELRMETLRGSVVANGFYETTVSDRPTFDIDLRVSTVDIPAAFAVLTTVQKLAPVARWAQGTVSGTVGMKGPMGRDMVPDFAALTGKGTIETDRLVVQDAPVLLKLADALSLEQLRNPALGALQAAFEIVDGRLHVTPFVVRAAGIDIRIEGSNGVDQSLRYDLGLAVPRAALGAAAASTVSGLATRAGKAGIDLTSGELVRLGARIGGTVTDPTITANFVGMATSARDLIEDVARQELATRAANAKQAADSAAGEARRRARAEADRIIGEAERQAATIRAEARELAATAKREGNERADSLLARATNPGARIAAQLATDRLRREADLRAERFVREADSRADDLVARAKQRANALVPPEG